MKLSLCMIVKNEESYLEDCLKSVYEYVDEIILVDTGSTDKTVEIAQKYTQSIYSFKWCDDFSKARNYAIEKANNDWVLILDADEVVKSFNIDSVNQFDDEYENTIGRLKILNNYIDGDEVRSYVDRLSRVFNRSKYKYEGAIHEQVVAIGAASEQHRPIDIVVEHRGYMDDVIKTKSKTERNIQLLKAELEKNKTDVYILYQIGKAYQMQGTYTEAVKWFGKALENTPNTQLEYVQDLLESYGYALLKCGRYSEALELSSYEKIYDKSADFMFMLGSVYMNNALFDKAIKAYKKSVERASAKVVGVNSYLAHYNLGVIFEVLGNYYDAYIEYEKAGKYEKAKSRMMGLEKDILQEIQSTLELGDIDKSSKTLDAYRPIIKSSGMEMLSGIVFMFKGQFDESESAFKRAIQLDPENIDAKYNLGYLYAEAGSIQRAIKVFTDMLNTDIDLELRSDIEIQLTALKSRA